LRKAAVDGDVDMEGSVVVGQIVGILNKKQSTKEIMEELIGEYKSILSKASQYI
jgi:enoyl-[acyl-carrier protein] reductase II